MSLSSNSLFHFTKKIETLQGILRNDFLLQYSIEDFIGVIIEQKNGGFEKAVPMVCFCDIPLSKVASHSKVYGSYSIGLTKEWAVKNQINPIIYSYSNSQLSNNLRSLMDKCFKIRETDPGLTDQVADVIQYLKPYIGEFVRNGKVIKNFRFYDEREWRYIENPFENAEKWFRKTEDFEENVKKLNAKIVAESINSAKLKFEAKDIKHIIVKDDKDIHSMMSFFKSLKSSKYSVDEIELLLTKISSLKDIIDDY